MNGDQDMKLFVRESPDLSEKHEGYEDDPKTRIAHAEAELLRALAKAIDDGVIKAIKYGYKIRFDIEKSNLNWKVVMRVYTGDSFMYLDSEI